MNTGRVFLGSVITILGTILLLNKLGFLDWSIWHYLIQFWPVLLIIWGIQQFTSKSRFSFSLSLLMVIVVLAIGFGFWNSDEYKNSGTGFVANEERLPIGSDIEYAKLKLDYGAGKLNITEDRDRNLAFIYNHPKQKPKVSYETSGKEAEYRISQMHNSFPQVFPNQVAREWDIGLPQDVTWDIEMNVGAFKGELDFREIDLHYLDLNTGAGDISLQLGDRGLDTKVSIDAGASRIKVFVPETVNLQISIVGALNSHNLDSIGLVKMGDYYTTPDTPASSKLQLELTGGTSKFELVRRAEGSGV